jgi:hypothetical protein
MPGVSRRFADYRQLICESVAKTNSKKGRKRRNPSLSSPKTSGQTHFHIMLNALLVFTITKRNRKRPAGRNHFHSSIRMDKPFPENDLAVSTAFFANALNHQIAF